MDDYHAFTSTRGGSGGSPSSSDLLGCLVSIIIGIVLFAILAVPILIFKALPDFVQGILALIFALILIITVIYGLFFKKK